MTACTQCHTIAPTPCHATDPLHPDWTFDFCSPVCAELWVEANDAATHELWDERPCEEQEWRI